MAAHWIEQAIFYHIYVRSFKDSNGDGVGDLRGVISKLDYLERLQITAIWLSPIYPSPMADFGYDVANYEGVDPLFGTMADFDDLIATAHQKNIKVLMDYIPNHTSSQHPWFLASRSAVTDSKRDWYIWKDAKADGSPPNNWVSVFGGSAWEWDESTQQYYLHSFDKEQPDLNWRHPDVVKNMKDALRFWLDKGVDGFRVDAYDFLFKHAEFLDEPANLKYQEGVHGIHYSLDHIYSFSQPETLVMLKEIAEVIGSYDQKFMVIEIDAKPERLLEMYRYVDKSWFATFNFGLIMLPWSAKVHRDFLSDFDQKIGPGFLPTYVLGNHDQPRVASRVGLAQARNAAILLLTLRGIPFVYYGDELGMVNGEIPPNKIQDPFELKSPGLKLGRDPERTPMQWNQTAQAGFSQVEPWLPVNPDYTARNVDSQLDDPGSFLNLYQALIKLRRTLPALNRGSYEVIDVGNDQVLAFLRIHDRQKIMVILNYSNETQDISLGTDDGEVLVDSLMTLTGHKLSESSKAQLLANQGLVVKLS